VIQANKMVTIFMYMYNNMKTSLFISTKLKGDKEKKYLMKNAAFSCAYLIFVSLITEPADFVYNGCRSLLLSILFSFYCFCTYSNKDRLKHLTMWRLGYFYSIV